MTGLLGLRKNTTVLSQEGTFNNTGPTERRSMDGAADHPHFPLSCLLKCSYSFCVTYVNLAKVLLPTGY
jgi:hypothetical protein